MCLCVYPNFCSIKRRGWKKKVGEAPGLKRQSFKLLMAEELNNRNAVDYGYVVCGNDCMTGLHKENNSSVEFLFSWLRFVVFFFLGGGAQEFKICELT